MQVDSRTVKKHFEKSMSHYDKNAIVQQFIAKKMIEELVKIKSSFQKVLELGSGTGLLTKEFISACKYDFYVANDLTDRSKFYLDKFLKNYDFICGNAEKIKAGSNYDLIISNAMFQWFSDLKSVLDSYHKILKADGILAFTTFSEKNFNEVKNLTGLSLNYKSLDEIKDLLSENYEILHAEEFEYVMKFSTPLELLAHMKHTGVNSLGTSKWTVAKVKDFCEKYKEKYPEISLTYSPIILIVQKK